jgi:hypothetical protein
MTKKLLTITALVEMLTGLALLLAPALVVRILLGANISTPVEFTIARLAGSAILSLAIVCWLARNDQVSQAARALLSGMLVYNIIIFVTLAYFGISSQTTVALIAALIAHFVLAAGCILSLRNLNRALT